MTKTKADEAHQIKVRVPAWVITFRKAYRTLPDRYGWLTIELRLHLESHGYKLNL